MKEIFVILICLFITMLLSPYILICIARGLKKHLKAKDMTLKQRIKKSINEEFNPVIA
jgi:predicted Holliday junction resolvase-like endonuclease